MFGFDEKTILYTLLIGGGLAAAITLWFKADTRFEELQRAAAKLAGILRTMGFVRIPDFLDNLAIKDISGAFKEIFDLVKLFTGPGGVEAIAAEVREVGKRGLKELCTTVEGRAEVRSILEQSEKQNVSTIEAAAKAAGLEVVRKDSKAA